MGLTRPIGIGKSSFGINHIHFVAALTFYPFDDKALSNIITLISIFGKASSLNKNFSKSEILGINISEMI